MTATTSKLGEDMQDAQIEAVANSLRQAWQLGQTYWQQADSESWKQQDKSNETRLKFESLMDETRRLLARQPAAIDTQGAISVQEAWEAAGGNPGIRATKAELLTALKQLDEVCDAVPSKPAAIGKEAVCIGSVDVVDGRVRSYTFEQTDVPTGSYGLYTSPPDKEASKPAPSATCSVSEDCKWPNCRRDCVIKTDPAPSVKVYPQGVMGIPPYSPPGSGSMTVKPNISRNAAIDKGERPSTGSLAFDYARAEVDRKLGVSSNPAPSVERDERGGWDGDSEESRTAFRDCDSTAEPISLKTPWQIWRSACAWQARAASTTAVAQDESEAFRAWYSTHKVTGDVAEAAWMARAASTSVNVASKPDAFDQADVTVLIKRMQDYCDSLAPPMARGLMAEAVIALRAASTSSGRCFFCGEPMDGTHEQDCPQANDFANVAQVEAAEFKWPKMPGFPAPMMYSPNHGHPLFSEHQMQGYANAYGEAVRAALTAAQSASASEGKDGRA